MLSLITCSRQSDISPQLRDNIAATIGVPYEVIVMDNSDNRYSIFEAYNEGVRRSRYPFVLFMHDDILYHTADWGKKLLAHFEDKKVGAVGVAGTPYLSQMPGGWWMNGMGHLYLLQSSKGQPEPEMQDIFPEGSEREEVVVLDGVWFCIRKQLFEQISFDEQNFKGFHFYDADISLQVFEAGYKLLCIRDILIHHLSMGTLDQRWEDSAWIFYKKWKHKLPLATVHYPYAHQCQIEQRSIQEFMDTQLMYRPSEEWGWIYRSGLKYMAGFRKGWLYYKTPMWMGRTLMQYLSAKFTPNKKAAF
jgi:hypothetical protein